MKNLILAILLSIFTPIPSLGGDSTNGVFYVNNPVECRLIAQSGVTITNYLSAGKTYMVRDALLELEITNKTIFYFSGGLTIESGKGSLIGINVFDQEVNNLNAAPRLAEFGNQNIGLTLTRGEFVVLYSNTNDYAYLSIMTPHTGRSYSSGKYVFVVDDKTTVSIIEGQAPAAKVKKSDGKFVNKSKTKTTTEILSSDQVAKYIPSIDDLTKQKDDVRFFVVGNQVIGISLK